MQLVPTGKNGKQARVHDCGAAGMLTAKQAAAIAGVNVVSIYNRLGAGIVGDGLVAPPQRGIRSTGTFRDQLYADGQSAIFVACSIAQKYQHRIPTVDELRSEFGMCRATAYRWTAAIRAARGAE
ncbi:hypothetical protein [Arenimonas sp.]|uniref:hypothetical protein n=1 Tax=Arenimonas sp. TaxID=1872635 RepID=UPI0039E43D5F